MGTASDLRKNLWESRLKFIVVLRNQVLPFLSLKKENYFLPFLISK
jgi:hypothetical protein